MERFEEDAKSLSSILYEIASIDSQTESFNETVFETLPAASGNCLFYDISFISPNTKHPLQHIVAKSKTGFFFVGKAVIESALNEEGEEEYQFIRTELFGRESERVLVGTPISQDVCYLNGIEPLHQVSTTSVRGIKRSQCCVFERNVANLASFQPVSLENTRYIMSLFDFALANNLCQETINRIPLWVLVGAEDNPKSVTHMACFPKIQDSGKKSSVNHVIATTKGPFSSPDTLPKMSFFRKWHSNLLGHLETSGYAMFELLGLPQLQGEEEEELQSSAYMEFAWKEVENILQLPPLNCDSVLHVQSYPGSMELTAHSINIEIARLCSLCELLEDPEKPWPCDQDDAEPVLQKVEKLLESLNTGELYLPSPKKENDETNLLSPLGHHMQDEFTVRNDLDFTESLWLLLKDALDLDDLFVSLQTALFALLNGSCQSVIHSSNKTKIAVFVRELLTSETKDEKEKLRLKVEEILYDEEILKCLVQIGIEKLLRDLTNFFLSQELVTHNQLSFYVDNMPNLVEKVCRVTKLHNILDLVLTTKYVINAGHADLQVLTQAGLSYYENHEASEHPVFSLSLPAFGASSSSAVKAVITSQQPSVWCLSLMSKSHKGQLTSMVQLNTVSPVNKVPDFLAGEELSMINANEDVTLHGSPRRKIPYYLTCAKQTQVPLVSSGLNFKA